MLSISVFIFAFNEVENLAVVVQEIYKTLVETKRPYEIVIIDDGSSDGTGTLAERLSKQFNGVSVIHHQNNLGLGGVYRTAFINARCDLVTFFSADGQIPADIIEQFISVIDNADMVLGYLRDRKRPLLARSLSMAEKTLYRLLFGPLPKYQGVMMFRRTLLNEFELKSRGRGWTVLMELIIRAQRGGYRILSVPTDLRPRMSGKSKVYNLSNIWANLSQAIVLRCNF